MQAPVYSVNGGAVPVGFVLGMTNPNGSGVIHYTTDGSDPRLVGGAVNPDAETAGAEVVLVRSGPVKARVLDGGRWSALNDFEFLVGVGGSAENLVVSEIHYNPAARPGDTSPDQDDYEFLELLNLSPTDTLELTGVRFEAGITFDFTASNVTQLGPGERVVVVRNLASFVERYPGVSLDRIAGEYGGSLDNSGERLLLVAADGSVIKDFSYDDRLPWPESADGEGYSLVLNCDSANPDHSLAENWRSHFQLHGNPGGPDGTTWEEWALGHGLTGAPEADQDGDGSTDVLEYGFGSDPLDPGSRVILAARLRGFLVEGEFADYLTLSVTRNLEAGDLVFVPEISTDLATWSSAPEDVVLVESVNLGNGRELLTWRSTIPYDLSAKDECFIRVRLRGK